ncbi:hypothetical protein [Desulfosediminicola flagellatus]|uniref:hypothetical protein n=1 Tax=Desulfosediminicola flagellatus TaxID=2569541 RepID=UPI0010ABE387|nr:hypothetical protein [Desulfosediminicola flagellatus]
MHRKLNHILVCCGTAMFFVSLQGATSTLQAAVISGAVTSSSTGDGVSGACVYVLKETCGDFLETMAGVTQTISDGTYQLDVSPADGYYLSVNPGCEPDTVLLPEYWTGNGPEDNGSSDCSEAVATPPVTTEFPLTGINFSLDSGVVIEGYIRDTMGAPLSWVCVNAYAGEKCDHNWVNSTSANDTGYYRLIVPGQQQYFLNTNTNCSSEHDEFLDEYWDGPEGDGTTKCYDAELTDVPVSNINFQLDKDTDSDGLSDTVENQLGLLIDNQDSDGDGIGDSIEAAYWAADYDEDIDDDGTRNIDDTDADGDGISDIEEFTYGSDIRVANSEPVLRLYEDFSTGTVDSAKFKSSQITRETTNGDLHLGFISPSKDSMEATLKDNTVKGMKVSFTIDSLTGDYDGAPYFGLDGNYYNDTASSGVTGTIMAGLYVERDGDLLTPGYYIGRFTDENWTYSNITGSVFGDSQGVPLQLAIGTSYQASLVWDGDHGFTFTILDNAGNILAENTVSGPAAIAAISGDRRARVRARNGGQIAARIHDFYTAGEILNGVPQFTLLDDFTSSLLSSVKWKMPEMVLEVTPEHDLRLLSQSFGDTQSTRLKLAEKLPYVEVRVRIDEQSVISGDAQGRMRLASYLYNDSHGPGSGNSYNGHEGDYWAKVMLEYVKTNEYPEGRFRAQFYVTRVLDADFSSDAQQYSTDFTMPISFNAEYILHLGFNGEVLVGGIYSGDKSQHEIAVYMPTTDVYPGFNPSTEVISRVRGNGTTGMLQVFVDEIKVAGESLEKEGDVNVDGSVDLKDAILSLKTLTGSSGYDSWTKGDADGDGRIGLPEAVFILDALKQ